MARILFKLNSTQGIGMDTEGRFVLFNMEVCDTDPPDWLLI